MDDFELDDFEDLSGLAEGDDFGDFELDDEDDFDFEDMEGDELVLGGILGGAVGGQAGKGLYDLGNWAFQKYAPKRARQANRALLKRVPNAPEYARGALSAVGAGLGKLAGTALPWFEADPYEPEYESDAVDEMETLMDVALEADGEDAADAIDAMVSLAFGPMRAAASMRHAMTAIRQRMRQLVARARRDPAYRAVARVAPIALRRTAVLLLRRISSGQRITPEVAVRTFAGVLSRILQNPRARRTAIQRNRARVQRSTSQRRAPQRRRPSRARAY